MSKVRCNPFTKPVETFPSLPITEAEVFALLVAQKAIAQYHGTPYEHPLKVAFRKLTGHLDTQGRYSLGNLYEALSFRPYAPGDADLKMFEILTWALREQRAVKFAYKNLGVRAFQKRHVHPYHLACSAGTNWKQVAIGANAI